MSPRRSRASLAEQWGLFDVAAESEPEPTPGRSRPGVRYKRRGAADDCAACWAAQRLAEVEGRPIPRRQLARWVREEDRDLTRHSPATGAAVTPLCATHKAERELSDRDPRVGA